MPLNKNACIYYYDYTDRLKLVFKLHYALIPSRSRKEIKRKNIHLKINIERLKRSGAMGAGKGETVHCWREKSKLEGWRWEGRESRIWPGDFLDAAQGRGDVKSAMRG